MMGEVNLEERTKTFQGEFAELLDKHGLKYIVMMEFPVYAILPAEVELAINIINNHGVQYRLGYQDNPKKK